jgi:type IV secretion system protein VirD4
VGGSVAGSFHRDNGDPENGGIRREPTLPEHEAIAPEQPQPAREFALVEDESDDAVPQALVLRQRMGSVARQAALDPDDGTGL